MSYANPVNIVRRRDPRAKKIKIAVRFGLLTPRKYPKMFIPGNSNSQAIKQTAKDHGHNFPRKCRRLIERCARHQVNGAFIVVPRMPIMIPIIGGEDASTHQ